MNIEMKGWKGEKLKVKYKELQVWHIYAHKLSLIKTKENIVALFYKHLPDAWLV